MGRYRNLPGLTEKVADLQTILDIQDPCDVMELKTELDVLCVTIKNSIVQCNHQRAEKMRLGLNRDIGTPTEPVRLGDQLEGFKIAGVWTYRNSNPRKSRFCTKWIIETDTESNADFDRFYVESLSNNSD